ETHALSVGPLCSAGKVLFQEQRPVRQIVKPVDQTERHSDQEGSSGSDAAASRPDRLSDLTAPRRPLYSGEPPEEDLNKCPRPRCPPWCDRSASWRRPATPLRRPTLTCWTAFAPPATTPLSPRWCGATALWSWGSAGACCAITRTPRTPSRPPSLFSLGRPRRFAGGRRWPAGCTASPGASSGTRGGQRPGDRPASGGRRT